MAYYLTLKKKKTSMSAEFSPCVTLHSAGELDKKEIKTTLSHKACQGHSAEKERNNDHHHVVLLGIYSCGACQFCSSSTSRWHHESPCEVKCGEEKKRLREIKILTFTFLPRRIRKHKTPSIHCSCKVMFLRSKPSVAGNILHDLPKSVNTIYLLCTASHHD